MSVVPETPDVPRSLSSPLTLPNGQVLPNRIMKSALSEALGTSDNAPDIRLTRLYGRWAEGGYGLLVTGNVMVDHRHLGEPGNVAVEDRRDMDALSRWAKTAQDGGTPIWMQINHPGRQGNPVTTVGGTIAPSAVGLDIPGIPAPRAATTDEIESIIERFAVTAALAEEAGFDGVQIHAAHGYLVSQFLSPLSNVRTDEWGGDIDGRARFLLEVIRRVRSRVSPGFAVGVKLNSADFQRGGFSEDESRAVIAMIGDLPVDLIEISGGSYESPAMMGKSVSASTASREAYFLEYAVTVRDIAPHIPLAVTGGFRTRAGMDDAIASSACHVVGLGRPTAVAPDAARDVLSGRIDTLPSPSISVPVPARFATTRSVRSLDGLLDLQWHTDQLHRMGAGKEPDPARPITRTLVSSLQRNGIDAVRAKRRGPAGAPSAAASSRMAGVLSLVRRYVVGPIVRIFRGGPTSGA